MVSMYLPPDILDLTSKTPVNYRIKNRPSAGIDTVVLHQTSFSRGSVPELYLSVHAHFVVLPDGRLVQLHPIEKYLIASTMVRYRFRSSGKTISMAGRLAAAAVHRSGIIPARIK
jgi:hypothetical protein